MVPDGAVPLVTRPMVASAGSRSSPLTRCGVQLSIVVKVQEPDRSETNRS